VIFTPAFVTILHFTGKARVNRIRAVALRKTRLHIEKSDKPASWILTLQSLLILQAWQC
jgi:hypothetical protein